MPTERTSPSAGWREVYAEMGAGTAAEDRGGRRRSRDRRPRCRECDRPAAPEASGPYCRRHAGGRGDRAPLADEDDKDGKDGKDDGTGRERERAFRVDAEAD